MDIGANDKFFLYITNAGKAATIEYNFILEKKVDPMLLNKATSDAISVFRLFTMQPIVDKDGSLRMIENKKTMPVFKRDSLVRSLGSEDTNGYLFRILYDENQVIIEASHGLGDARAVLSFSMTLLYYYFLNIGYDVETQGLIFTKKDLTNPTLLDNMLERISSVKHETKVTTQQPAKVFVPTEPKVCMGTAETRTFSIAWNQESLKEILNTYEATPVVFFHMIISRTMKDYYNLSDESLVANVPVDLRPMLDSHSQSNFTFNVNLPIYQEDFSLNDADLIKKLKTMLKENSRLENLADSIMQTIPAYNKLDDISLRDEDAVKRFSNNLSNIVSGRTYLLSNIGKIKMPENMASLIKDVKLKSTNLEATPVYVLYTYKNLGRLMIFQNYTNDGFVQALSDKLRCYGLINELEDLGLTKMDDADVLKFFRIN